MIIHSFVIVLMLLHPVTRLGCPQESSKTVDDRNQVARLIEVIDHGSQKEQQRASRQLVLLAGRNNVGREETIKRLISFVGAPNIRSEIIGSEQKYRAFKVAVAILGELRATEALDILVACLDCNDLQAGDSAARHPVTVAIARVGEAAIPALTKGFAAESAAVRMQAAEALAIIGGDSAKRVLERALSTEQDEIVRGSIRSALAVVGKRTAKV